MEVLKHERGIGYAGASVLLIHLDETVLRMHCSLPSQTPPDFAPASKERRHQAILKTLFSV
eukprot:scaffold200789_cov36-Prasinocladus_malaysianus.AAC.1